METQAETFIRPLSLLSAELTELTQRLRLAEQGWATERQSLLNEIHNLRRSTTDRRELSTEIAQTETALIQLRSSIDGMTGDPSSAVSKLVRATAREAELQAYLKGLQFKANLE